MDFLALVQQFFPSIYDLKTFHELGFHCEKSKQGDANFAAMAKSLRAKRTGTTHNASFDALLTFRCFIRMMMLELPFRVISRLKGDLFGIVDASNDSAMYDLDGQWWSCSLPTCKTKQRLYTNSFLCSESDAIDMGPL
jgi:hypothetical protein